MYLLNQMIYITNVFSNITLLIFILFLFNFLFLTSNHPLSMTIIIIIQSLISCLIILFFSYSSWFSYILFLSFLGGMLVIFIYMTTLASNEKLTLPKSPMFIIMTFMSILTSQMLKDHKWFYNTLLNNGTFEPLYNFNQLFIFPNMLICIMMISYLLITLIAVVKISNVKQGTLRHSTYE